MAYLTLAKPTPNRFRTETVPFAVVMDVVECPAPQRRPRQKSVARAEPDGQKSLREWVSESVDLLELACETGPNSQKHAGDNNSSSVISSARCSVFGD